MNALTQNLKMLSTQNRLVRLGNSTNPEIDQVSLRKITSGPQKNALADPTMKKWLATYLTGSMLDNPAHKGVLFDKSGHIQGGALSGDMAATIREIFLILATPGGLGTEVLCVARKMITGTSTSGDYKLAMKFQWNAGTQKFVQAS